MDGLGASTATWNVLAQQVIMAQRDVADGTAQAFSMDQWDGYVGSRNRILGFIDQQQVQNPVVITGDVHSNWAANLKTNFDDPSSRTVGVEFVGTSISSGGDGSDSTAGGELALRENPHYRFFNAQRGYVRCSVTPSRWQADYRVVPFVYQQGAPISTRRSFVTEAGNPGLEDA
jgi:alkaline phosphatase D